MRLSEQRLPRQITGGWRTHSRDRPYPQLQSCSRNSDWEHENQQCLLHIGSPPRLFSSAGNCCNQAIAQVCAVYSPHPRVCLTVATLSDMRDETEFLLGSGRVPTCAGGLRPSDWQLLAGSGRADGCSSGDGTATANSSSRVAARRRRKLWLGNASAGIKQNGDLVSGPALRALEIHQYRAVSRLCRHFPAKGNVENATTFPQTPSQSVHGAARQRTFWRTNGSPALDAARNGPRARRC
jgi:hypothetical protein